MCIYIYIYRERERDRERCMCITVLRWVSFVFAASLKPSTRRSTKDGGGPLPTWRPCNLRQYNEYTNTI